MPYHLATAPRDISSQPTWTFSTHPRKFFRPSLLNVGIFVGSCRQGNAFRRLTSAGPGWNRRSISRKEHREEPARRRRLQRLCEERTLTKLASEPNETLPLCNGVHTLCDHTQVKRPGQVNHRTHNLQIRATPPHTVDEHVVDLDTLDG